MAFAIPSAFVSSSSDWRSLGTPSASSVRPPTRYSRERTSAWCGDDSSPGGSRSSASSTRALASPASVRILWLSCGGFSPRALFMIWRSCFPCSADWATIAEVSFRYWV